jgi:tetratricopeptide (TPR) repeat protein
VRSAALASLLVVATAEGAPLSPRPDEARVRALRLRGALGPARAAAEQALANGSLDPASELALRLELSRVHDRIGLHQNTRPVTAALEQIEAAAALSEKAPGSEADVEFARAEYRYRAEMDGRQFRLATLHADRAAERYRATGDRHGEADAVHLKGLIHLQRGESDAARKLFDRSLELDRSAGERPLFRGDYERHVGFLDRRRNDLPSAIRHFEESLRQRWQAGDVDASLFAANALASALVDAGRLAEARAPLLEAMMLAQALESPNGKAQNGLVLGRMYEKSGDARAARVAHELALGLAAAIALTSVEKEARAALERLGAQPPPR